MSFVGSVGPSMKISELEKLLQQVYGAITVSHKVTGKAISKALRGNYQMDSALHKILFDLLMLQKEPSREDFSCRQRRTIVITIEVLTKEEVIEIFHIQDLTWKNLICYL